jgi:HD-GYP domain-containing protein (c-di-GMP phosphodiesterase class II)
MEKMGVGFDLDKQRERYKTKPYLVGLYDIVKKYTEVEPLLEQLENFDEFTFQHSLRAETFAWNIAEALELSKEDRRTFCLAALMHDVGKMELDKDLINKHPFGEGDLERVKPHVVASFRKIYAICPDAAEIVLRHHCFQKYFYPSDEEISQLSKIDDPVKLVKIEKLANYLALIDNFETHSGERPGKDPEPLEKFLPELAKQFGSKDDERAIWKLAAVLEKEDVIKGFPSNFQDKRNLFARYPMELLREYEESFEHEESHGIMDIKKRREQLLQSLAPQEKIRLTEIEREINELVADIKNLPRVRRLTCLDQLGGIIDYENFTIFPHGAEVKTKTFHTRYHHSELLAEQIKFAGVKLGLSIEEIKILVSSAWLHDIGHPALSHVGDELLKKKGRGDHESRAIKLITDEKGNIFRALKKHGIEPQKIAETIKEEGYLGSLQSVCDTLSYLIIDSAMVGKHIYHDTGAGLIGDLSGIDKQRNIIIVKTTELWKDFLEKRASLMKDLILHPFHRRCRAAVRQLLLLALDEQAVTLEQLEKGSDEIIANLQSQVQKDARAAVFSGRNDYFPHLEKYINIWSLAHDNKVDSKKWQRIMFENEENLNDYLFRTLPSNKLEEILRQTVIVSPFDYTRKTITVLPEGSQETVTLQAQNVKLRDEDTHYIVFIPKFIK